MKTRRELYNLVIELNLSDLIKEKFNKPYTNCTTELLNKVVEEQASKGNNEKTDSVYNNEEIDNIYEEIEALQYKVDTLINILVKKRLLLDSELDEILDC